MDSEFKRMVDLLRALGIRYTIRFEIGKPFWQNIIEKHGHNFTANACVLVEVNDMDFLFLKAGGVYILNRNRGSWNTEGQCRLDQNGEPTGDRRIVHFTDPNQLYEQLCEVDPRAR